MTWISLSIRTDSARAETLADALLDAGALSVGIEDANAGTEKETPQFDEPGFCDPPVWACSRVAALFDPADTSGETPEARFARCAAQAGIETMPPVVREEVREQDWVRLTQSQFDPIRISNRLWIVPSWHEVPDPGAIALRLDPGLAFGTGSHPTTRLCLEWIEHHVKPGSTVLDYGCGSGILAIAAAKFGASSLTGVDIDPQALPIARQNAAQNKVDVHFADTSFKLTERFDIVVANILSNPLKALSPVLCALVRPGGKLALSGILEAQADSLIALYALNGLPLGVSASRDGWVCLSGERRGS